MSDVKHKHQSVPEASSWSYKGHHLKAGDFVTSMAHEFRAEVQRANMWRTRLDATTNWAVAVTGVSISMAFSQPNVHHGLILLNALLVTIFLFIEARRYRYYEMWSHRVRLLETGFFAAMLVSPFRPSPEWAETWSKSMRSFDFTISLWKAVGYRLRRNYLWIFFIIGIAWLAKYSLFPTTVNSLREFLSRAAIGSIPGSIVVGLSLTYFGFLLLVAIMTFSTSRVMGERLPVINVDDEDKPELRVSRTPFPGKTKGIHTWYKQQNLAMLIITNKVDEISMCILRELDHDVTAVPAKESALLICVLREDQSKGLKAVIFKEDPEAMITILPAEEVWG